MPSSAFVMLAMMGLYVATTLMIALLIHVYTEAVQMVWIVLLVPVILDMRVILVVQVG